jgi:Omp85 superfamily domain
VRRDTIVFMMIVLLTASLCDAQQPEPSTRTAVIEEEQARKVDELHPYVPNKAEKYVDYAERVLSTGLKVHPFFQSAYSGGGFTMGAGYRKFLGGYDNIDVRGSITFSGYKRLEAEFVAPRLFDRQGHLSVIGGWREATAVGYYGPGMANSSDDRANYGFKQPYGSATLDLRPGRRALLLRGGLEATEWQQTPGSGSAPSVDSIYTPETLPGLGASVTYLHSLASVALDTRPAAGYTRRGGSIGVTYHDFADRENLFGFSQVDYEALGHVPLMREAWVLSFRGYVSTTATKAGQDIPFFMLPSVGGGSSLRGFSSWRFRDRNSLLLQAEWRAMVNRFVDMAVFYDAGKVTAYSRDLNLHHLKSDVGLGFRFHGPMATPFRVDFAKGQEGFTIVWAASAAF